jgi:hypothetical protein
MRADPRSEARPFWGLLAALLGVAAWLLVDPRTPDLAGQVYRAHLFAAVGLGVWDTHWYGGHAIPGYSLLFPPLGAWLGVRAVGALAVLVSAALFERLLRLRFEPAVARWGAVWFALAALGDAWSGRVAFALGVSFALAAVAAFALPGAAGATGAAMAAGTARPAGASRPAAWTALAILCAALGAAASPVAGALLALAAVTYALLARAARGALVLALPALLVVALLAGAFGDGGWEPYPLLSFVATVAVLVGFLVALPARERVLRAGALVYLLVCAACVAIHTPMGANVERYAVLLAGPLLLCAVLAEARRHAAVARTAVAAVALAGIAVWTAWGPVRETAAVAGNPSTAASYYAPVARFVAAHGGELVRVEVPFTRGHWEAAWLAPRVLLARGWEKQLDERYDGVLLGKHLTAASYRRWLLAQAVGYVALPDAPLDSSSAAEGHLIAAGLPYLRLVAATRHWRIFAVRGARALARGPGTLTGVGHDWFALRARAAGRFVVRVHFTRYWTVTEGAACVRGAPGGWTAVRARRAGRVVVRARFSLARAFDLDLDGGQGC